MPLRLTRRRGSRQWYLRGTVRGKSIFETTKTADKKVAEEIRTKRENALLEESIHGRIATVTFAEAALSHMEAGGSPRFLGKYDPDTGEWSGLIGHFGKTKINTINQSELDKAAEKLYPGTSYSTKNRQCHAVFIAVYNHAVRNNWATERKWARPRKPKGTLAKKTKQRAGSKPVSYERAAQFVLAMSPAPAMVLTTLFYSGMRPIELFTLEREQVKIKERWITLPDTKTGEPRGVPMHEMLVPLFTALCAKRSGILFLTPRGKPYPVGHWDDEETERISGQMKTAIYGARRRSGIKDVSPYTGRHSCSTQLVINGVHEYVKDQILGHASASVSRDYVWIPQAPLIKAINTLPVIEAWAKAPWMLDPIAYQRKLAAGTGKRTDLLKKAA